MFKSVQNALRSISNQETRGENILTRTGSFKDESKLDPYSELITNPAEMTMFSQKFTPM